MECEAGKKRICKEMGSANKRKNSIPVVIVEDHNEVLHHIYRGIGSKKLPFESGSIVHFDSHPDMVIPENFDTDRIFDKEYVLSSVSIESWLLPAVYAKHFSSIAWVKPPWASQLSEGRHEFQIGHHHLTKKMKLTCPEAYFVSELAWAATEELEKASDVVLEVCTLADFMLSPSHSQNEQQELDKSHQAALFRPRPVECLLSSKFLTCLQQRPYVLDMDLDFFSTRNPFLDLFTKNQFKLLSGLYHYEHPSNPLNQNVLHEVTSQRQKQLEDLHSSMHRFKKSGGDYSMIEDKRLALLLESFKDDYLSFDVELVHNAGCTCDDCDLPHHVSTRAEVRELVEITKEFLRKLPVPSLITISRSSQDDYCPPEDVEYIQDLVIEMLNNLYGSLNIQQDYDCVDCFKDPQDSSSSKNFAHE